MGFDLGNFVATWGPHGIGAIAIAFLARINTQIGYVNGSVKDHEKRLRRVEEIHWRELGKRENTTV